MRLSNILITLIVVVGLLYLKGKVQARVHSGHLSAAAAFAPSTYVMESPPPGSPRLSYRFLDDHRVQMFGDNLPWGKNDGMCSYEINGDVLVLTHACGVWRIHINGDVLHVDELNADFRRSER